MAIPELRLVSKTDASYVKQEAVSRKPKDKKMFQYVADPDATSVDLGIKKTLPNSTEELAKRYGISSKFVAELQKTSGEIHCNPEDLIALMKKESSLDPKTVSKRGNVGLIQFTSSTAENLGTTSKKLKEMSSAEQLKYVEKYFNLVKKDAKIPADKELSGGELYGLTLRPSKVSQGVLCRKDEACYKGNSNLDNNQDGKITTKDLQEVLDSYKK